MRLLFMRCMTSNGICRGFAFKYGKFPLPLRYRTALSVPKVPTMYNNPYLILIHTNRPPAPKGRRSAPNTKDKGFTHNGFDLYLMIILSFPNIFQHHKCFIDQGIINHHRKLVGRRDDFGQIDTFPR